MPDPRSPPRTVVVVVTFNGADWIRGCLASVLGGTRVPHVVVVDNASADGTARIVEAEFPAVELIRCPANVGFGRGNNVGIRRALALGAEHVFLLNQDAYVLPGSVAELEAFMDAHAEFGVASPMHCSPDADHIDPRTLRGYLQTYAPDYLADACVGRVKPWYATRGVNAAAWFLRRSALERVGGFDPIYFMYGEDDDLLHRFEFHRVAFAWVPSVRIVHLRQSPAAPRRSWWQQVARLAGRQRSHVLRLVKHPDYSVAHMAAMLLSEGWVTPLALALARRAGTEALSHLLAAVWLTLEFPRIVAHARRTARPGPHFL